MIRASRSGVAVADVAVSLPDMVGCVDREVGFRLTVYPRWVDKKKMTPRTMNEQLDRMRAVRREVIRAAALTMVCDQLAKEAGIGMGQMMAMIEREEQVLAAQFPRAP